MLVTVATAGCSNYEFRYGPYGSLDSRQLIEDLKTLPEDQPSVLRHFLWIPLIYTHVTMFHRTSKTQEPAFPFDGYTLRSFRGVGPLGLFWTSENHRHYDPQGETYHRREGWGIVHRLFGSYEHRVSTDRGEFAFQEYELLFGLIKSQGDGYVPGWPVPVRESQETAVETWSPGAQEEEAPTAE